VKLRKQFLSTDYEMQLYERFNSHYVLFNEMNYQKKKKIERFNSLKQRGMSVEEYTSEFNNLSIQVGLNETNKQMTYGYHAGLQMNWEWFIYLILKILDNMP
jgi:hypothetical protein